MPPVVSGSQHLEDRVDSEERAEIVELDANRYVYIEYKRNWPKYVASWSIRQRVGEGDSQADFPVARDTVELLPPGGKGGEEVFTQLHAMAMEEAMRAQQNTPQTGGREESQGSWIGRLFGR